MMIQKRQFRETQIDKHYCAAIFRYVREYALLFKSQSLLIGLDDKHRLKVGEPNFPVVAAEMGHRVIVSLQEESQVGDHDFTRFSIIHCVIFCIDIPETIEDSWYEGQVCVILKEAIFQPSSPTKHRTEQNSWLQTTEIGDKSIMFLYTDGGPHHRVSTLSQDDTSREKTKDKEGLQAFLNYCCQMRHYTFCIKQCGQEDCTIYKPVWMDKDTFKKLRLLPDCLMQEDGHYLPFDQAFTRDTTEQDCPLLKEKQRQSPLL